MKKSFTFLLLAFICICGYAQTIDPALLQEMRQRTDDEKIRVVVIMKSQYDRQQLGRRAAYYTTRAERREFVVNELKQFAQASQYDLRNTLAEMERQDMTTAPKIIWMANAMYFSATKQAIYDLANRRDVGIIGFDEERYALFDEESSQANMNRGITSNVTQVNADQVWDLGYTGQGVVVAVIDTGVNYNHLDLADHLWDGGAEYPHHGYDFYNDDNDPMDDHSHGTHCAGTVCGDGTAGQQTGMAPDATLMCVKVLNSGGSGYVSVTCNAMQWAVEQGCDLFSMSLGWASATITERELFRNTCMAVLDAGVVGAIAAGNEGSGNEPNNVRVPGSCPPPYMDPIQADNEGGLSCTVCVGAVDVNDNAASFTSRGPVTWQNTTFGDYPYTYGSTTEFGLIRPDVCAPGVSITSADYSGTTGYSVKSGTSMATPCVAGCISLLLSKKADATPEEICQVLEETAVPLATGKSNTYGYGRVDVLAAINALYSGPLTLESFTVNDSQGNNDGKLNAGESVRLSLTLTNESELALNGATMTLTSESEYVTITDGSESLPSFNVGQTRTINNMFAFSLSDNAPAKRNIQFLAETFVNGESVGAFRISVMVYGHILRFDEVTVLNDNNGNGSLEAGETANLHVVISNVGNDPAASVVGALSTTYPYLTINSNNKSFGSLEVNEQASADYNVTLANGAPDSYTIGFSLDLVDAVQKHTNVDFELWRKPITLTSNPAGAGTLTGGGYYGQGQTCTITATPNEGYAFVKWTLNGSTVSYLPTYTFEVTGEANYVANFQAFNNSIFIGDGSTTNAYLPSYSYYSYTLSQQIYTADEINMGAGEISSVSFFNAGSSMTLNYTIYMVNTNKTAFDSNNDWITVSENDQVFNGSVAFSTGVWTTVYFNPPFNYDGTSNIALIVDDNTGSWWNSMSCRVSEANDKQSIYVYNDYTNYDPYNPSNYNGTRQMVKNQIVLGIPSYDFTVTATPNNEDYGSVSVDEGPYYYGQNCTVTATSNTGYCFYNWTENGTVVSSNATYTFPVTGNRNLVANFGEPLSITVSASPAEGGTVSGAGTFDYGATATITATANEGYVFYRWTKNGSAVSYLSTYSFAVTSEAEYVAEFQWVSNGVSIGNPELSNYYLPSYAVYNYTLSQQIYTAEEIGMPCEISSISFFNVGYLRTRSYTIYMKHTDKSSFESSNDWISVTEADEVFTGSVTMVVNGWTSIAFDTPFIYDGTSNLALIVDDNTGSWSSSMSCRVFESSDNQAIYIYSDNTNYDPFNPSQYNGTRLSVKNQVILGFPCSITATANPTIGGTVSGTGSFAMGATCTLTATPNDGYLFVNWTEDGTVVSYDSIYSFTVSGDRDLVANFAEEGSMCRIVFDLYDSFGDSWNGNYLVIDYGNGQSEQITISSGSSASYSRVVATGSFITLTWIAGYYIGECSFDVKFENGVLIYHGAGLSSSFLYEFILDCEEATAPHTITAVASPVEGGTVEGAGTYNSGTVITMTATPNSGYTFMYWTENGTTVSSDANYSFLVSSDRDLVAHFSLPLTISVTANMTEGGTVTGSGTFNYGATCTLNATPNPGYVFNNWTKNGSIVSCLSSLTITVTESAEYVANFQQMDGIIIGDALSSSYYLPTYYYYSLTEQIYTASEMGGEATDISSVSFFNTGTYGVTRNMSVYMVNTNKNSFGSTTDWIPVTDANLVFSGNVTMSARGWVTIYFSTPFSYDGVSNVALIVDDNSYSYNAYTNCRTFDTEANQALSIYSYSTDYDPYAPNSYTGTLMSQKNQVIFGIPSYDYTITVSANPTNGGTVSGGGGLYFYGQPITITATPAEGYVFNNWTKNGEVVSYLSTAQISVTETAEYVANFQQVDGIVIGDALSSSYYLPTYYYYSLTEQIYTASEMGGEATDISSVSFFNTGTYGVTRNMSVYMVNTDKTSFGSTSDWISVTDANLVFSGNVTMSARSWVTIYFSTPFTYDGVSNVALVVDDNSNSYNSYTNCRTFNTNESQAIRISGSGTDYDPYAPNSYTGTLMSQKNQVIFGIPSYDYTITVSANPTNGGTVSGGGGSYFYGQPITIVATPVEGYVFNNWTKNGEVVSYLSTAQVPVTESAEYVANFQQVDGIVIGDATSSSYYLPTYYYNSLSEQIYTASEMGGQACEISSVSFFNTGSYSITRNLNIYMVNTDKTAFESTTDWIPVTEENRVFSGNVIMTAYGWITIYFNTPFAYDGSSNVALIVDDNSNSYNSYTSCRTFNTEQNQTLRIYGYYGSDYDPMNPSEYTGTLMTAKNQIILGIPNYGYTITATADPEEGGTVSGGGSCFYGQPVILDATPNPGYVFSNWMKNDEVLTYLSPYNFSVTESAEYVANFEVAPNGIAIGTPTYTNSYLPTYSYYPYSLTQQIYTSEEMGDKPCEISSVSFFNTGYAKTRNLTVYMVSTEKTAFESNNDWIAVTEADQVFSGNVTMPAYGLATISFNTSFSYDGASNVALIVDDNTNSWNSGLSCRTFSTTANQAIRICGSGTNYDPSEPYGYSGTPLMMKNQVIFGYPSTITATANPTEGGTVFGSGNYAFGATCTLTATPNAGYYFLNWTEDGTVVSYDASYSFTVESHRDLVANFIEGSSTCVVYFDLYDSYGDGWNNNYLVIDYGNGNSEQITLRSGYFASYSREIETGSSLTLSWISGYLTYECSFNILFENDVLIYHGENLNSSFQQELTINCAVATAPRVIAAIADPADGGTVEGAGTYDSGTTITLTATPNEGYTFMYWTENGTTVSTEANYSFLVSTDRSLVAHFTLPYTITATAEPSDGGEVSGAGMYEYGTTCTLTATPNEGYTFCYWSENGQQLSTNTTYSFMPTSDRDFVAHFSLPLTISVVTNLDEGGTATGAGTFEYGSTCILTATPNVGYVFMNWSKDGEVIAYTSAYSFTVTEDAEYEAVFMYVDGTLIGSGEATNMYLPSYSFYCYTLSQQIYTPDEIGAAGSITSVSYFNASNTKTRNYSIYMVHTDKLTFANNSDWIAVTEADLVYTGNVTMTKGVWTTIEFDTPFAYNGTSNLAIVIDDNTGSYTGSPHMACRVFNTEGSQAIRVYSDGTNYDPYNPSGYSGTLHSVKNQIILGISSSIAQTFTLTQGWNWFSTYLNITLDDLKAALVSTGNTTITIKSKNQNIYYQNGRWRGSLNFDVAMMYKIYVETGCEITLEGLPIDPTEHSITIHNGPNWIGFPLGESMSLSNAFAGFAVNGDVIKHKGGSANYLNGHWRGAFNLEPGQGYIYKSNVQGDRTLTFPTSAK